MAVQDMEVRQMELDAQRRLFEQVSPIPSFFVIKMIVLFIVSCLLNQFVLVQGI